MPFSDKERKQYESLAADYINAIVNRTEGREQAILALQCISTGTVTERLDPRLKESVESFLEVISSPEFYVEQSSQFQDFVTLMKQCAANRAEKIKSQPEILQKERYQNFLSEEKEREHKKRKLLHVHSPTEGSWSRTKQLSEIETIAREQWRIELEGIVQYYIDEKAAGEETARLLQNYDVFYALMERELTVVDIVDLANRMEDIDDAIDFAGHLLTDSVSRLKKDGIRTLNQLISFAVDEGVDALVQAAKAYDTVSSVAWIKSLLSNNQLRLKHLHEQLPSLQRMQLLLGQGLFTETKLRDLIAEHGYSSVNNACKLLAEPKIQMIWQKKWSSSDTLVPKALSESRTDLLRWADELIALKEAEQRQKVKLEQAPSISEKSALEPKPLYGHYRVVRGKGLVQSTSGVSHNATLSTSNTSLNSSSSSDADVHRQRPPWRPSGPGGL